MAKRSLQASPAGVKKAKQQFALKGWTQEYLANEVGIKTRQPIWRFFDGQAIERYTFFEICTRLDLDWREIALDPPLEYIDRNEDGSIDLTELGIDALVQTVRSHRREKINHQCGILQLLDVPRPIKIEQIYIDVNILEQIASQQWLEIASINSLAPEDIDRFGLGKIVESQIPGMQAVAKYNKLRVLGKPGSGKSTFLKHLAIECNREQFVESQIPIFIKLRDFAESRREQQRVDFLEFIHQEFLTTDISQLSVIKKLLQAGRILLLIDGMDEVAHEEESVILNEIRRFSEKYHKNQFVATCRTASQKLALQGFTDVEIAPFTQKQITYFSQKWFVAFTQDYSDGVDNSRKFIEKLELPENWRFRRMITTPLFLHLACSIFHRQGKFPIKQAEFYKQGMDLLLGKWDEAEGIERDQIYRGFLLPQKLKLLSQIASATFEQGQYFFEQGAVEQYIGDYLVSLPDASTDPEEIQQASEDVLRAIESQHGLLAERARGIFSFSYLALQEYFTARKIVANHNLQALGQSLQGLVNHITDPHWREIFLLTASMLRSADGLVELMKQQIDALVSEDPHLQDFLAWASQKSQSNPLETKSATGRAFYLALTRAPNLAPDLALACTLDQGEFLDAALDDLLRESVLENSKDFAYVHACGDALSNILGIVVDIGFHKSLQQLSDQLPNNNHTKASFDNWCNKNYATWVIKLQEAISAHRNIGNKWEFSLPQEQALQYYYDANQLLLDCLNSNCEVTASIREEIEATLLLPQQELEEREWE
ncbi:NACHT domain-containing NTPase [Pseudanabaena galeata UHCC 0370]|uniref:NACHT domain-containing NTPase n=1 Tax=Pseudanabaena galeata UHCC 0370 TaxID=3110310 RepID=A0ABU5TG20_9CYAN|nr:NACHT domain-containing NTPase [Pseudanabaena galeata]MEA5477094.1 NACHT domain-containing NTPase [Pseudanabaena galeata UHCC 0370]